MSHKKYYFFLKKDVIFFEPEAAFAIAFAFAEGVTF